MDETIVNSVMSTEADDLVHILKVVSITTWTISIYLSVKIFLSEKTWQTKQFIKMLAA